MTVVLEIVPSRFWAVKGLKLLVYVSVSPVLRQAALNYMSDSDCFDLYQNANLDTTDDMQCFGTRQTSSPHQEGIHGLLHWRQMKPGEP